MDPFPSRRPRRGPVRLLPPSPLLLAAALLTLGACTHPTFKGPQLQQAIPGFFRVPDAGQGYRMFPERETIHYDVWVNAGWGEVSTIHINGYPGRVMRADVQGALEAAAAHMADSVTFSGLQELVIDGRTGWGWSEKLHTPARGLAWIRFRVAVPYDTITYTVEAWSGDPALKGNPDTLVTIVSTFGVGKVTWNFRLILLIVAAALVLGAFLRERARKRAERLRSITFVKLPPPEEEGEGADAEGAGGADSGGTGGAGPEGTGGAGPDGDKPSPPTRG